uniref:Uncharacterized protein n=1 Tax=Oryza punctata TaxID=4537 RepID=A0A0E0JFD2_ORYPU
MEKWMTVEQEATKTFLRALIADVHQYIDMTEEDVVEEYRRAGKLHTYDPYTEWQKRYARHLRSMESKDGVSLVENSTIGDAKEE